MWANLFLASVAKPNGRLTAPSRRLKLAYASSRNSNFARFGARLDDDTRKIIEHGRRIRACLKQPESAPLAVPAQITVLLALTANLFDPVPLEKMAEAGHAVREAASSIPAEISARLKPLQN